MITIFFTGVPVVLGLIMIAASVWEFFSWKTRFGEWKRGVAKSLGAVKRKGEVGPHLAFEYTIDGVAYEGRSSYMRDDLPETGERVAIYYDPNDPAASEWFDRGMHNFFLFGVSLLGTFLIWMAIG